MMRQSILFSSYDCPEVRALFSKHLCNVAGKHRTYRAEGGVLGQIRPGIRQVSKRFALLDPSRLFVLAD